MATVHDILARQSSLNGLGHAYDINFHSFFVWHVLLIMWYDCPNTLLSLRSKMMVAFIQLTHNLQSPSCWNSPSKIPPPLPPPVNLGITTTLGSTSGAGSLVTF